MTAPRKLFHDHLETAIGILALVVDGDGRLRAAGFTGGHARMARQLLRYSRPESFEIVPAANPGGVSAALGAYFGGALGAIDRLPVFAEGTDFQRTVWSALREIPCGETWSYAALARRIGNPAAVRAVGLANGANPIAIVVPCHRVIGSDGSLTGYGGGIERKRWLLAHEGCAAPTQLALLQS